MGALDATAIADRLSKLDGWKQQGNVIRKLYQFANYHETLAFVNASAWVAHRTDHHPDLEVGYNRCRVSYTTHDADGLTDKDFNCAARLDALFQP